MQFVKILQIIRPLSPYEVITDYTGYDSLDANRDF